MPMLLYVYPQFIISLRPNTGLVFPAKTQRLQDSNPFICHIMLARTVLVQLVLITLPFGPPVAKRIDRSFDYSLLHQNCGRSYKSTRTLQAEDSRGNHEG